MSDDHIDLGVSQEELYGEMGGPISVSTARDSGSKKSYPTIHYCGPEELDLPQEGTMKVGFFKKSETSKVDSKTGKHWYECDIEVRCICEVEDGEPDEPTHRDKSAEEALDEIARLVTGGEKNGY
jgi:hypothetical protein